MAYPLTDRRRFPCGFQARTCPRPNASHTASKGDDRLCAYFNIKVNTDGNPFRGGSTGSFWQAQRNPAPAEGSLRRRRDVGRNRPLNQLPPQPVILAPRKAARAFRQRSTQPIELIQKQGLWHLAWFLRYPGIFNTASGRCRTSRSVSGLGPWRSVNASELFLTSGPEYRPLAAPTR